MTRQILLEKGLPMSKNSFYRFSVVIFGMAVCLAMPACRTCTEKSFDDNQGSMSCEADRAAISKLKRITIPEMTFFSPATLVDALDFIVKASRDCDLSEGSLYKRGVSYRLRLNAVSPEVEYAAKADPFVTVTNDVAPRIAAISVCNISVYDALQLVCDATEMCWHLEQGIIVVEPNEATDTRLVTRSYSVPPVLQDCFNIDPFQPSSSNKTSEVFFAQLDMKSPKFSEFTYDPTFDKLHVTGTPRNLKILETVLGQFAFSIIEVEMQIHAFRIEDIERLRLSSGVSLESLMALRRNGKAKPVASATALTKSGQEAIVKAVQEVIYPEDLLTDVSQAGSNVTVRSAAQALIPGNFSMRETGMTLQVVPEIMQNNAMINMTLKPQWVTLDRWASYPADLVAGWTHVTRPFKCPVFGVTSLETQAVIKDGETLLIGSSSTQDGEWVNVGFLTTRLKPVQPRYVVDPPVKVNPQEAKKNEAVMKKLNKIFSPDVNLSPPSTIIDAIRLFKEASINYDESDCCEKERGVNFVLKLPESFWDQTWRSTNENILASVSASNGVPRIPGPVARYLSLFDAIKLTCDVTGMRFSIRNGIAWIFPPEKGEELVTRTYYPAFSSYQHVNVEDAVRQQDVCKGRYKDWKPFFEPFGVQWSCGSSISCLPRFDLMRVTATHENLEKFEQVCKDISFFPRMVEVDVQIHAFSLEDIEKVRISGDMSVEALMAMRRKGKARPVASATAMTKSGQEAVLKAVQEVVYPTKLLTEVDQTESPVDLESNPQALIPGNFTTRETGMTLQVVPEVSSTDPLINVTMKSSWVTLEGWKSFPVERASSWKRQTLPLKQPIFRTTSFEMQALVKSGETVLLGSSSSPDGKWVNVGFLTVK